VVLIELLNTLRNRNQHADVSHPGTVIRPAKKGIKAADAITTIFNDLKRS